MGNSDKPRLVLTTDVNGTTTPDNLRLLCRRHHRMAHDNVPYPQRE